MSCISDLEMNPTPRDATYKPLDDNLFELTLTHENKTELLKEAISKLSQSSHEACSILENLTKWNPSDASLFVPRSSSTILDTPLRLIFPKSALPSFKETGLYVRQYLAISYCWHSDEFLPEGYERYGNWPISKPFVNAILSDKDHPREGIWMDQLCIDQSSSVDKGKSVAAMDIIYRSCIRLIVLLEDVFLDEREAELPYKYDPTKMNFNRTWLPEGDDSDLFTSFYIKVNAARWWKRAWCVHEFSVNDPWTNKRQSHEIHNATFVVNGPNGSTVKIKWVHLQLIMGSALFLLPNKDTNVLNTFNGQYIFSGVERDNDDDNDMKSSLMARYNGVIQKGSTYLADRLSIILNMCGLGLAYIGDELKSEDEVLYFSILLALAIGENYPLSMFSGRSVSFNNRPTWLARSVAVGDTSIPRFRSRGVRGIHRISTHEIELDMIFFNSAWERVKDEDLRLTYTIFPEIIPTTPPGRHVPREFQETTTSIHPDSTLDKCRRRFLAGCIMNGYCFTTRLWVQLKCDVVTPNYNTGVFRDFVPNPSFGAAAQEFMAQLLPVSGLLCVPAPSPFTLEDAQLFLTWLTDPRSMYYIGAHTYRFPCTSEGQRAVATALHINEHFDDEPLEELQIAVPIDTLFATCMALRIWILRPGKDEGKNSKWRLVGKCLMLGEPNLMNEWEKSSGEKGVVVSVSERIVVSG
jgi:hypothetical protein